MIDSGWLPDGRLWIAYRLSDAAVETGIIGLQVHGVGNKTNDLQIHFRNIRIKELP